MSGFPTANHSQLVTYGTSSTLQRPSDTPTATHPIRDPQAPAMASTKPLSMLARSCPSSTLVRAYPLAPRRFPSPATVALFSTTFARAATPAGPPPPGFRLPRPQRWDEGEKALDKAGKYFLLLEMARGMYVALEQFFRPP